MRPRSPQTEFPRLFPDARSVLQLYCRRLGAGTAPLRAFPRVASALARKRHPLSGSLNCPGGQTASESFERDILGFVVDSGKKEAEPRGMQNRPNQPALEPHSGAAGAWRPAGGRAEKVEEQQGEGGWVRLQAGERRALLHETFRGMKSGAASRTIRSLSVALPVHRNTPLPLPHH